MKSKRNVSIESLLNNRKLRVFLIFIGLSFFFWFLTKLSHNYNYSAKVLVEYTNIPKDKILLNEPTNELYLTVNSQGFNSLSYQLKAKNIKVDLSKLLYKGGNIYYYLPNQNLAAIASKFDSETKIYNFNKDTIFIELEQNGVKKVKIVADTELNFKIGYDLSDAITLNPDSIKLFGPQKYLDTIQFVKTEKIKLKDIASKINEEVILLGFEDNLIRFSDTKVMLSGEVEKFTEETITVPLNIVGVPNGMVLTVFPKEVKLVYKVGLTNYNKISKNSFVVDCNYQNSLDKNIDYLEPIIRYDSTYIQSIKIYPKRIDYLIKI